MYLIGTNDLKKQIQQIRVQQKQAPSIPFNRTPIKVGNWKLSAVNELPTKFRHHKQES